MKTVLNLKPAALRAVKSVSRRQKISLDEAASTLILQAVDDFEGKVRWRHGIPLARNDGVEMTSEEIAAAASD